MMIRGGGVAGQKQGVWQIIARAEADGAEIQHDRDQHNTREFGTALALQVAGQCRRPRGPVTFPGDVHGRLFPVELGHVVPDEIADRGRVLFQTVEQGCLLGVLGPTVAGADRVDEHQVGDVQDRTVIVNELGRSLHGQTVIVDQDPAGAEETQVDIGGRGPRPAVEAEREPPRGQALPGLPRVGDVEDVRLGLARLVHHRQYARGRPVLHFLPGDDDRPIRHDQRRQLRCLGLFFRCRLLLLRWCLHLRWRGLLILNGLGVLGPWLDRVLPPRHQGRRRRQRGEAQQKRSKKSEA